jgi:superfamily II DNA/RNA helicase
VVAITGERVSAAHGKWSRAELLHALGPRAGPLRDDDPRAIRILLATDLLAEGVELQGVRILVHADRTWTPARHEQREGRIARIGAAGAEVLVTRMLAPLGAVPLLRLSARLARKQRARVAAVESAEVERCWWRRAASRDGAPSS